MSELKTKMGVLLRFNIQSYSDIITNSSSEIFCSIESNNGSIEDIAKFLSEITGVKVEPAEDYEDDSKRTNHIDFWAEYSAFYETEYVEDMFIKLLEHSLSTKFTKGVDFEIITDGIIN